MSLDADMIVDRRRMRRKLTFWRVFAVLLAICAVVAIGAAVRAPGSGGLMSQTSGSTRLLVIGSPARARTRRPPPGRCTGRR